MSPFRDHRRVEEALSRRRAPQRLEPVLHNYQNVSAGREVSVGAENVRGIGYPSR
jgi:hypothetical protein